MFTWKTAPSTVAQGRMKIDVMEQWPLKKIKATQVTYVCLFNSFIFLQLRESRPEPVYLASPLLEAREMHLHTFFNRNEQKPN